MFNNEEKNAYFHILFKQHSNCKKLIKKIKNIKKVKKN
jgi:hypothetical protein